MPLEPSQNSNRAEGEPKEESIKTPPQYRIPKDALFTIILIPIIKNHEVSGNTGWIVCFGEEFFASTRLSRWPTAGILLYVEDWPEGV